MAVVTDLDDEPGGKHEGIEEPGLAGGARIGAYNTLWAVILPVAALQLPFTVLLARNFVDGIPDEMIEAARVDGAGMVRTFWSVILPLTRPIIEVTV